jgi:hypothetical protein
MMYKNASPGLIHCLNKTIRTRITPSHAYIPEIPNARCLLPEKSALLGEAVRMPLLLAHDSFVGMWIAGCNKHRSTNPRSSDASYQN